MASQIDSRQQSAHELRLVSLLNKSRGFALALGSLGVVELGRLSEGTSHINLYVHAVVGCEFSTAVEKKHITS